jgi:calcium homeostasis endoplasmic reticulum protein
MQNDALLLTNQSSETTTRMSSATPAPPNDPEIKNIIDKLSNFVARNGPEFENVTKLKQKDNPKFRFLFGEEYHDYYHYKVELERENIAQQQQQQQQLQPDLNAIPLPGQPSSNEPVTIGSLQSKINTLKGQISESETNLSAQNDVFQIKKKVKL